MKPSVRRAIIIFTAIGLSTLVTQTNYAERAPERFSIEAILAAPFPQEIVGSATSPHVAYVTNEQGRRSIWVVDHADAKPRAITRHEHDDGIQISALAFTPAADWIVYQRGDASGGGPINAASSTQDPELAIYAVPIADGAARKIDDGAGFAIHPDGAAIAYVKQGAVWRRDLGDDAAEPQRLFAARGGITNLAWSPQGDALTFVSQRGSHSFVGVWRANPDTIERIQWLAPSTNRDLFPQWSPTGEHIAFLRLPPPTNQPPVFRSFLEDLPFSIHVANATTGIAQQVFVADRGRGSAFRPVIAPSQLFWGANDELVFPWEKTGWLHLYAVSADGGPARPLTDGEFVVRSTAIAHNGESMFVVMNEHDRERPRLSRVSITDGSAQSLTSGKTLAFAPTASGANGVAFLISDATRPVRPATLVDGSVRTFTDLPSDFPEDLVEPIAVDITATDGQSVRGQLFVPPGTNQAKHPAVVYVHGGPWRQMFLGWHNNAYYSNAYALNQYLASRGIVVLSLNYRSGIGYGLSFREAAEIGQEGNAEFRDVLGAALYLKSRDDVHADRIGIWGGSYGGYLTAHALAQASDLFRVGVDIHGVHDWNEGIRMFFPNYDRYDFPAAAALAFRSSPLNHVDTWQSPVLLIHADDDRNVFFTETVKLSRALRERGVHVEELVFPDDVHGFLMHENWIAALEATAEFLMRELVQ